MSRPICENPQIAIKDHVDNEDKTTTLIQGTGSNYKSNDVCINESGVYSLVFGSKLPQAKEFIKHLNFLIKGERIWI